MDYQGRSIQTGAADPAILVLQGEIAALQSELKTIESELAGVQSTITAIQGEAKSQEGKITDLQAQVVTLSSEINNLSNAITILQNAPSIGDCASIVLTCPVLTDTATLRVPISYDWSTFYSTGYSPPGTPFDITPFAATNFGFGPNPSGFYWSRPASATGNSASFEIDASCTFIPSVDMAVRVGIRVVSSLSSVTPLFVIGYNESRYTPTAFVATWDARLIVSVPLNSAANYVIFQVESRTTVLGGSQFVYGVGESFSNQHHLIVKRIN
jgi:hypothetical protein